MKTIFTFAIVSLIAANTTFGGEIAADGTQSVLVQPAAPVVVVESSAPCVGGHCHRHRHACANGQCSTKLYNVEESSSASCRNRLFGGTVVRKSSRTVLRPVR
jgi:hypothetical protein